MAAASPSVIEGLRARIGFREAAGWLGHSHTWLHPRDLALTDAGLTGAYTAAALSGRLGAELPTMTAQGVKPDVVPFEDAVSAAHDDGPVQSVHRVWWRRDLLYPRKNFAAKNCSNFCRIRRNTSFGSDRCFG